jgi:hypothetical protein
VLRIDFKLHTKVFVIVSGKITTGKGSQTRETREGWPLLTVETEENGDSKRTRERGSFFVGSLGLSCQNKNFVFCLGKQGRQPCWVACLLVCVSVSNRYKAGAISLKVTFKRKRFLHSHSPSTERR